MSLKARLDTLRRQAGAGDVDEAAPAGRGDELRARLERLGVRAAPAVRPAREALAASDVAAAVGGEVLDGGVVRVTERVPLTGMHGQVALSSLPQAGVLPGVGAFPGETAVFLDTETSGLAGGTGTVAYVVGLARLRGAALELVQYLMTGFSVEAAMLSTVRADLADDDVLVSFNGKSFDAPLLQDRFRLTRQAHPLNAAGHADLLYPLRRLFAQCWPDCRLVTAERRLLGFERDGDLPGSEAPLVWSELVRGGQTARLPALLRHNRWDLLSLAALWPRLAEVFTDPMACGADALAAARAWYGSGCEATARAVLESARPTAARACHELARLRRRAGDWAGALQLWEALAAAGDLRAVEALAKYHEHVRRDWDDALAWTDRLPGDAAETAHRRRRLQGKRARGSEQQPDLFA